MSRAVCRVCLAGGSAGDNVRLHNIDDHLLEVYEKLTSVKLSTEDEKRNTLCYICYSQLQKCCTFSDRGLRSEKYLQDVLESGTKVNEETASGLNLTRLRTLSMMTLKPLSLDGLSKSKTKPNIKKDLLALKNEPENTKRFIKTETAADEMLKNKVTTNERIIKKVIAAQELIKNEDTILDEIYNEESNESETSSTNNDVLNDIEPYYECNMCDDIFLTQQALSDHKNSYIKGKRHVVTNKKSSCPVCKKMFVGSMAKMVAHLYTHTGERPYVCDQCGKAFRAVQNYREHIRGVHIGVKVYCKVCNKGFTQGSTLKKHMLIHTGEQPYCCHICGKSYKQSGQMRAHIRIIHEGERRFSCDVCNKRFSGKSHLQKHMSSHSPTKAFSCDKCRTKFATNDSRRRHMKHHCKKNIKERANGGVSC